MNERQTLTKPEMSLAGFLRSVASAPNWLAAESVWGQVLPPRSIDESANSLPILDRDLRPQTRLFASASEDRLQISLPSIGQL